jgi:SAM-dependent methyltransferase
MTIDYTRFRPPLPPVPHEYRDVKAFNRDTSYGPQAVLFNRGDHGYCNIVFGRVVNMLLSPRSVVEFGSANGYMLSSLYKAGVHVKGFDISVATQAFADMAVPGLGDRIERVDLNQHLDLREHFDVAVSTEVLEHLPPESADLIVKEICESADVCIITASPGGGTHPNCLHLNEQPFREYWLPKFEANGKVLDPVLTNLFKDQMRLLRELKWYVVPSWFVSGYFGVFVDKEG